MYAKVFSQIYDSSIVEKPEVRFTFMDFLVLADKNGVVDMTHEAISRRTNRPIEVIRETVKDLEGTDDRSRSPDFNGARIKRLDDHRDWGWFIVNYDYFRKVASEEQRREKTLSRVHKHRKIKGVTQCNAVKRSVTKSNDSPYASAYTSDSSWIEELIKDKTYSGIDIQKEFGKARQWCKVNHRTLTRKFFVNWLNRAEKPLAADNKPQLRTV